MKTKWSAGRRISFQLVMIGGGSAVATWKAIFLPGLRMKAKWSAGRRISFQLVMIGGGSAVTTWKVIFLPELSRDYRLTPYGAGILFLPPLWRPQAPEQGEGAILEFSKFRGNLVFPRTSKYPPNAASGKSIPVGY